MGTQALRWAVCGLLLAGGCGGRGEGEKSGSLAHRDANGPVVARVNGDAISLSEVEQLARDQMLSPKQALDRLIEERLLADYAASRGYGDIAEVKREVRRARVRALLEAAVEDQIRPETISEEQLQKRFEEIHARFDVKEQRSVVHVLFKRAAKDKPDEKARGAAEAFWTEVQAAPTAEQATALLEQGPVESESGGVSKKRESFSVTKASGTFEAPFQEAVDAMGAPGLIPRVVETSYGYHVIVVRAVTPGHTATRAELDAKLREQLTLENRQKRVEALIEELRTKAPIKYAEESIKRAFADGAEGQGS